MGVNLDAEVKNINKALEALEKRKKWCSQVLERHEQQQQQQQQASNSQERGNSISGNQVLEQCQNQQQQQQQQASNGQE
jgi:7,8-dihydro-6-hydroxymethylpterin-pyrophosphokinase